MLRCNSCSCYFIIRGTPLISSFMVLLSFPLLLSFTFTTLYSSKMLSWNRCSFYSDSIRTVYTPFLLTRNLHFYPSPWHYRVTPTPQCFIILSYLILTYCNELFLLSYLNLFIIMSAFFYLILSSSVYLVYIGIDLDSTIWTWDWRTTGTRSRDLWRKTSQRHQDLKPPPPPTQQQQNLSTD